VPMEGAMTLSTRERKDLRRRAGARNGRAEHSRPARLILPRPEGLARAQIRAQLDRGDRYMAHWSHRIAPDRLAGLFARFAGRARYTVPAGLRPACWHSSLVRRASLHFHRDFGHTPA
jgi:hypothetical protein